VLYVVDSASETRLEDAKSAFGMLLTYLRFLSVGLSKERRHYYTRYSFPQESFISVHLQLGLRGREKMLNKWR
jgi:hypothetical protein